MQALGITWRRISRNFSGSEPVSLLKRVVKGAFSDKYLLYTNVTISLTLSSVGDIIEQTYEIYTKDLEEYSGKRTRHMAFSGVTLGVLCHNWYKFLDKFIAGKTLSIVTKKLLLDQLIFSPIMILTFFGTLALFERNPLENFEVEVKNKFAVLYRAEWLVWPPAQFINFYFLPTRFRVLYDNTISLGYDVYTSQVKYNHTPHIKEKHSF